MALGIDQYFDRLPNELVLEVISYSLGAQANLPKRYTAVYVLSQVNRRLHALMLPILARDIAVHTNHEFAVVVKHFCERGKDRADCVRRIQVGNQDSGMSYAAKPRIPVSLIEICNGCTLPFHNLRSFIYLKGCLKIDQLALFEASPLLSSLDLLWDPANPFPDVSKWPQLRTLRLRISTVQPIESHRLPQSMPNVYSNLTTLAIQDDQLADWWSAHYKLLSFPNLRVLSLQGLMGSPAWTYHFIHRHPTLLEVNISFNYVNLWVFKFEGLMKLIDGTGTWVSPENAARSSGVYSPGETYPIIQLDDPCFDDTTVPPIDETYIVFTSFAFTRIPLFPEATRWDQPFGSREPRYTATALALLVEAQVRWIDEGFPVMLIPDFLGKMPERLPRLEVLRIASGTWHETHWTDFMSDCATSLRGWKCLRKLSLSWISDDGYSSWGRPSPDFIKGVLMFDDMTPPVHLTAAIWPSGVNISWDDDSIPFNFDELRRSYKMDEDPFRDIEPVVRWFLGEDFDIEAHARDRHVLMDTWEACNELFVRDKVRSLAACCPTLEEFEWYPVGPFVAHENVRWAWKVHREKDSDKVRLMVGDLTWSGCLRVAPPTFRTLVGQELEWAISQERAVY